MTILIKTCSKCKVEKDTSFFTKDNSREDGRCVYCKECRKLEYTEHKEHKLNYQHQYYQDNKNKIIDRQRDRRYSLEEFKQKLKEIHGDLISVIEQTYVNTQIKCDFVDKEYGAFSYFPYHLLRGCFGHPKRRQLSRERTWLKKYGVKNPAQNKNVYNKIIQTNLKRYGVENPAQNKDVHDKMTQTVLNKYGVDNPLKNKDVALKMAKSSNNSHVLYHWKTKAEIVCRGSYEKKTVIRLNQDRINFEWQPGPFTMPDGHTYTPDLLLLDQNLYVEIKGRWYKDAQEKWNWFHKEYPNSEVWDCKRLKKDKIL